MSTYTLPADGPLIATEADATDIIGEAFGNGAELVVIPAGRLSPEFFKLGSGLAGAMLQKFTTLPDAGGHRRRHLGLHREIRAVAGLRA